MAVAVKNTPETSTPRPLDRLAVGSLAGAVYLVAAIALAFYGLPWAWWTAWDGVGLAKNSPVGWALLIVVVIAAVAALAYGGVRLLAGYAVRGVKAGVFVALVGLLLAFLVTCWIGSVLESQLGGNAALGGALTLAVGVVLVCGLGWLFFSGRLENTLVTLAEQGWFTVAAYKRSQGQRVRRGTILGILVLAVCGIYTLISHGTLNNGPPSWQVVVPFTGGRVVPLLPDVRFTLPLLLAFVSMWLAYRVVNLPVFADFLVATEAELNKVSWTTRRRLIQDTVVVLVTVLLLTVFLFFVDQCWAWLLTRVGVLQAPPNQAAPTQREQPW